MTREPSVPFLTFDVDATSAGPDRAAERMSGFAAEHRVAPEVRATVGSVIADVVRVLGGRVKVEADLGERDLQVVLAHPDGDPPRPAYARLRRRLAEIGERCDGFAVERAGASGVEVWCRFDLRPRAA